MMPLIPSVCFMGIQGGKYDFYHEDNFLKESTEFKRVYIYSHNRYILVCFDKKDHSWKKWKIMKRLNSIDLLYQNLKIYKLQQKENISLNHSNCKY